MITRDLIKDIENAEPIPSSAETAEMIPSPTNPATLVIPQEIEYGGWSDDLEPNAVLLDAPSILRYSVMATIVLSPDSDEDASLHRVTRLNASRTFHLVSAAEVKPYNVKRIDSSGWVRTGALVFLYYEREEPQSAPLTQRKVKDFVRRCIRISGDTHHVYFEGLRLRETRDGTAMYDVALGS